MKEERRVVELLPHQDEFLSSKEKFVLLSSGVGGGKTWCGSHFVIQESIKDNKPNGLISANSYNQLLNSTLAALFSELDKFGLDYNYNMNRKKLTIEGAEWLTYSMDNYDMVRGIEVARMWNDETRDLSYKAFLMLLGRLRGQGAELKARFTSTPLGFNYLFDYFQGDKKTDEFKLIKATSYDNPFLPEGYIESMKASYDDKVFRQEVMGEFLNITQGRVYYAFERSRHVKKVHRHSGHNVWVAIDFNRNPMTATILQYYDDVTRVIDEFRIMSSDTEELGREIGRKYGFDLQVVPDATGKAIKTSGGGKSDHDILKNMGFDVKSTSNPFRLDRYNAVNGLFNKDRIIIDESCVHLIKDLEQVTYKEGTTLPDTTDKTLTHLSDGLGYFCWYVSPIVGKKSQDTGVIRLR